MPGNRRSRGAAAYQISFHGKPQHNPHRELQPHTVRMVGF
jgi:hypothetical protein